MPYIVGVGSTKYGKFQPISFSQFAQKAIEKCLADSNIPAPNIDIAYFGNCAMHAWGQANIRGQVLLAPFFQQYDFPLEFPL